MYQQLRTNQSFLLIFVSSPELFNEEYNIVSLVDSTPLMILEMSFDPFCKLIILDLFRSPFGNAKSLIRVRCTFLVSRGQFLLCRFMTLE